MLIGSFPLNKSLMIVATYETARAVPSLTAVGGALEDISRQQQMAPQQALAQYYNTIAPIAYGLPQQQATQTTPRANPLGTAAGGALSGAALGSMAGNALTIGGLTGGPAGALLGAGFGLLGGLL